MRSLIDWMMRELLFYMIIALISSFVAAGIFMAIEEIKEDIEICKSLGYDGVKFTSRFSNKVECSNFTDLQKTKREK